MIRRPPRSTRFPDTTLVRSHAVARAHVALLPVEAHAARPGREEVELLRLAVEVLHGLRARRHRRLDRKSTRLNSSHANISYAVFCLTKKNLLLPILHISLRP